MGACIQFFLSMESQLLDMVFLTSLYTLDFLFIKTVVIDFLQLAASACTSFLLHSLRLACLDLLFYFNAKTAERELELLPSWCMVWGTPAGSC